MATGDTSGAVNKDENHTAEGPSDTEDANAVTGVGGNGRVALVGVTDDGQNGDIEEEESGDELGDGGSVKRPFG